ncbi:hypothetical protein BpHYR1_007683 [Brachionus plicatilis]|uniref:Uncharacterized protein n=1 Tax=Brachionus plicatilis TaxID=10195 RepID=A0A3M7SZF4_BRAPC|nr:hypothetical protein BpHYR1_007683 [Brachionus plicatilis]
MDHDIFSNLNIYITNWKFYHDILRREDFNKLTSKLRLKCEASMLCTYFVFDLKFISICV